MSVVKKRKHVSKKNKKAWRKYCDISDVEAFLEDQRLEERLGKFETKPNEELFVVDTGASEDKPDPEDVKPVSLKLQKRAQLSATPKCYEVLLPTSKVEDPNKKRNHVNPIGFKPTALSKITDKRKFEKGVYQKKAVEARNNRLSAREKKKKSKKVRENFDLDLWGGDVPESKAVPKTLCDEFIPEEAKMHHILPKHRLRPKPALPKTVLTRKAIDEPHPGVSYNPAFQEHQDLLQKVVEREQVMMKREAHLHRVTTGMFSKVTAEQNANQWREEMSVGLQLPSNPVEESSESDTDNEIKSVNPPVKNKKKDHKARRKQKEQLLEKERLKRRKIDKQKITDLYKLRQIKSKIVNREEKQETERTKRLQKRTEIASTAVPALNAHKVPVKEPDYVAPEQLTGDLRNVASTTNLLRERFESLQHRGALAASKLMMKKRRKTKSFFKPGYKVTDKDVENYINRNVVKKK